LVAGTARVGLSCGATPGYLPFYQVDGYLVALDHVAGDYRDYVRAGLRDHRKEVMSANVCLIRACSDQLGLRRRWDRFVR
jgi:hypothetical protein